ncbi:DUF5677 domain-containing protein [Paenibacillus riograndensis]|nr:DUF5677 domain-containing protein [Paenibacillus riograndensis]
MGKQFSKLSDHSFKKGVLYTPFNSNLGDQLSLSPWAIEWLPEYLWLALILDHYGREDGLNLVGRIAGELSKIDKELSIPVLSKIFELEPKKQRTYYEVICKWATREVLSPLTIIYRTDKYALFYEYFSDCETSIDEKTITLQNVIKKNLFHQTNEATDIRFLILWFNVFADRIHFARGMEITKALVEYPKLSHDHPEMRLYRPLIRSSEMALRFREDNGDFAKRFWHSLGLLTKCRTFIIDYGEQVGGSMSFLEEAVNTIDYLMANNKESLLTDEKFSVCLGIATYALKIYKEVIESQIGDGILGRNALRTITEVYVTLKYMSLKEQDQPDIWKAFKEYGIGKYKYVILKAREVEPDLEKHHFALPVLEALLNEDKGEEFTNMDTRLFDNQNVRKKFEAIGENDLYDLYYEYDTNFTHGLWGAIRESAMIFCDNPSHKYHTVPDITFEQKLRSVEHDCEYVLKKLFNQLSSFYEFPDFFIDKYGGLDD